MYEFSPFLGREKRLLQCVPMTAAGQESSWEIAVELTGWPTPVLGAPADVPYTLSLKLGICSGKRKHAKATKFAYSVTDSYISKELSIHRYVGFNLQLPP